jgi:hypothetical protein
MNRRSLKITIGCCFGLVLIALLWRGAIPGDSFLLQIFRSDTRVEKGMWIINIDQVRAVVRLQVALWSIVIAAIAGWHLLPDRIRQFWKERSFRYFIAAACMCALFVLMWRIAYEGVWWYPIAKVMTRPGSVPIYGHRLLWVWLADAIKFFAPSLSYNACFYLSQIPPIILTVWMMGVWSSLFVGSQLQWIGQVLVVLLLPLTFEYFTFFDISIVFFYALCLYLLRKEKYLAFVPCLALATLNHENAMFLIPVAALQTYKNRWLCVILTGTSAVAYFGVRVLLQALLPMHRHMDWGYWVNLYDIFGDTKHLALGAASAIFWWAAAAVNWRFADSFLKRSAIIFPLLVGSTFLVGQFHEARQFDAAIPVVCGIPAILKSGAISPDHEMASAYSTAGHEHFESVHARSL